MGGQFTCGIFLINKNKELLVAHPTNHDSNLWSIPKGKPEEFETVLETAAREMREEINLSFSYIEPHILYLKRLSDSTYKTKRKRLLSFLCILDVELYDFEFKCKSLVTGDKINVPFPEMDDFKWVSLDEAEEMLHEAQARRLEDIRQILNYAPQ